MHDLSSKLEGYIVEDPAVRMTVEESRLYRTLMTESERFRACRNVSSVIYKVRPKDTGAVLLAIFEGRDARSVANQVKRMMCESRDGITAKVFCGKCSARVVVKLEA